MNMNKKLIALIAGLAGVALCVALLLFSCNGGDANQATEPSLPDNETVVSTDVTASTEEPTEEPTGEPTEIPTEEPTEPEETTAPTQPSGGNRPGGTGGFEGGSAPTTPTQPDEDKKDELTLADPGAAANPYAESLSQLPASLNTAAVPGGKTISYLLFGAQDTVLTIQDANAYVVCGDKTYEPAEGVLTLTLPAAADPNAPVAVQIGSRAGEEKTFSLDFSHIPGSEQNPEVIDSIDQVQVQLGGTEKATRYYIWEAPDAGKLTLKAESITPDTSKCDIALSITSTDANGVTEVVNGTVTENGTAIDAIAGDRVLIAVTVSPAEQKAEVTLTGSFEPSLGTAGNPIPIPDVMVPYETQVAPGSTTYYSGRASGMTLTIANAQGISLIYGGQTVAADENGVLSITFPPAVGFPAPAEIFALYTDGTETRTCTLVFTYPTGHPQNPAELVLGDNTATVDAENADGYNYVWTATGDGKLTVTMNGSNWQYILNNETAGVYGDLCDSSLEPSVAESVLEVTAGDQITLNVNAFDPEDPWAYPGGTVTFTASFAAKTGTEDSPIWITDPTKPFEIDVPANTTLYLTGRIFGVTMKAENAAGASVILDSVTYGANAEGLLVVPFPEAPSMGRPVPVVFALTNGTAQDATYTLIFEYPLGTLENPDVMKIGENVATLESGNTVGYNYTWTAPEDGELTVTMTGETWQYTISNPSAGIYGSNHVSDEEPITASETLKVTAGNQITMVVNTYTPGEFETPAGTVTFTAAFESSLGSESNPILLNGGQFPYTTGSIARGKTVYYSTTGIAGKLLSVTGGDYELKVNGKLYDGNEVEGNPRYPVTLELTNKGSSAATFVIAAEARKGTWENPDQLVLGDITLERTAGADGYVYNWTAEEDGIFILTMAEDNATGWQYCVNNLSTGAAGNLFDSRTPENRILEQEVKGGNKLEITVNTFDPENEYSAPAGTLKFTAAFEIPVGTEANPIIIGGGQFPYTTESIAPGETIYYSAYGVSGKLLTVTGGTAEVLVNGKAYDGSLVDGNPRMPAQIVLTNKGTADAAFTLMAEAEKGTWENPDTLALGETSLARKSGADGYVYNWTAQLDGSFTLTMAADNAAGWQYCINNLSTGVAGTLYDSRTPENSTATLEVKAGHKLEITVNTFDPENEYMAPAGTLKFTASFTAAVATVELPVEFKGEQTPAAAFDITLAEAQSLSYLDVAKAEKYTLVLDKATGIYHLDDLTGPVVYVNLGTAKENEAPYLSLKALLEASTTFGTATEVYNTCLNQYLRCADVETGLYPLTADLANMLQNGGKTLGWWNAASGKYLFAGLQAEGKVLNPENAWLFACCVIA